MVVSVYFLVESAVRIAQVMGLSQQVIGATIIAIGTSLPELTIGIKAILKGHLGLAFGDIIGSSLVNITLILGVTLFIPALIGSPISMRLDVFQNLVLFSILVFPHERTNWQKRRICFPFHLCTIHYNNFR